MARMVRFEVPVDPNNIQATAQSLFDALQQQMAEGAARRQEKIDALRRGAIPGGFAGPDESYPIASAEDARSTWRYADRADDPAALRASVRRIAKQFGWADGLPDEE